MNFHFVLQHIPLDSAKITSMPVAFIPVEWTSRSGRVFRQMVNFTGL